MRLFSDNFCIYINNLPQKQTRNQSLLKCFWNERRLGIRLRHARGLMGRDEGNIDETPRAPQPNRQFRAEKRSAQASAHSLSQAQGGNFLCVVCACLLLEF